MCYFNRLTRVACWLAGYPEWLQFCWDFVKPPRNDEIALQHFFFLAQQCKNFFLFPLCCIQFFSSNKRLQEIFFQNHPSPPPPQELNGRPLTCILYCAPGRALIRTVRKYSMLFLITDIIHAYIHTYFI